MSLGRGLSSLIPDKKSGTLYADQPFSFSGEGRLMDIPVRLIDPNPYQPRRVFEQDELQKLADSIAEKGLLQPIVVSPVDHGRYHVVVGERRVRAMQMLGRETIPAVVRSAEDQEKLELAIIENVQRKDLNHMERAMAYKRLQCEFGLSLKEMARKTGESEPVVGTLFSFLKLPEEMQDAIRSGRLNYKKARALSHALGDNHEELMKLWEEAERTGMSSSELEQEAPRRKKGKTQILTDSSILAREKDLEKIFGTRVRISSGRNGRYTMSIDFFSQQELFAAVERLFKLEA